MPPGRLPSEEILAALAAGAQRLKAGGWVLSALNPPPGPSALFAHRSHAAKRAEEVALIYRRLLDGREALTAAGLAADALCPDDWPPNVPFPADYSDALSKVDAIGRGMKVDLESLFHFGSVLLDQWALGARYLAGKGGCKAPFHRFVTEDLEETPVAPALASLRDELRPTARWLHFWMRSYRNAFVVHVDQPVQQGTNYPVDGDEFSLFTPTSPGWHDDERTWEEVRSHIQHAPELRNMPDDYWEKARPRRLLEHIVEEVGHVERQADRDAIANLARRAGMQTPSFHVLASEMAVLIDRGTAMIEDAAKANPERIALGKREEK